MFAKIQSWGLGRAVKLIWGLSRFFNFPSPSYHVLKKILYLGISFLINVLFCSRHLCHNVVLSQHRPSRFYRSTQIPKLNEYVRTLNWMDVKIELNERGSSWMDVQIELDKCRQGIKWMRTKLTRTRSKLKGD